MPDVTKEQTGFDKFKQSDTYAMLAGYMSQEPNIAPWTVENRIWTAYRAGWLAAQEQADRNSSTGDGAEKQITQWG